MLFLFFPSSLALVNGCTLWPQPGALGSVVSVAAATGPMTGMNTLTNSPSEPHLKAFRVDFRCSGKSMKSQLCSADRKNWLEPITVQRALRVRRLQSSKSCFGDTCWCPQCPRYVMDKAVVQGHVVAHCDENARAERRCDVPVRSVHARMDDRRKQSGDVGTRRVHAFCEWYGRYCVVSLFCEIVAKFRIGDAHSRKQEVDSSHWCFSVSSLLSLHANAERRECAWTEARAPGTWNRAAVEVETKRRPRDPGR